MGNSKLEVSVPRAWIAMTSPAVFQTGLPLDPPVLSNVV